jgi:predicted amidophosphoribosyltransferase
MQMMGSTQTMACPNCNTTIPANSRFCPSCGQELKPQVKQQTVTCPACGKTVPLAKFCGECGAALMETKKCPSCKKEIPAGAKFCPNCGKTTK